MAVADLLPSIRFSHDLLRKPNPDQHEWLRSAECRSFWDELTAILSLDLAFPMIPGDFQLYESQYIATFDVGQPHPPVPLIESHYNKAEPVPRILHENILFYTRFGLELREDFAESADHLLCQLSFMAHLLRLLQQHVEVNNAEESAQFVHAIGDFSDRHLRSWIPRAVEASADVPNLVAHPHLLVVSGLAEQCSALRES
jgi:DMSO reductase family type II enzyme chaperone